MDPIDKLYMSEEARMLKTTVHMRGHWGHHGNGDNGWIGYLIVVGIFISSFIFLLLFSH